MTNKQRAAFEAWAKKRGYDMSKLENGAYANDITGETYIGWRAAIEADRKRSGEPVPEWANRDTKSHSGWINELGTLSQHPDAMSHWLRSALKTIYLGLNETAPQPAEPVSVPSDAEIDLLAYEHCDDTDASGEEARFTRGESIIAFARALLAKYGNHPIGRNPDAL